MPEKYRYPIKRSPPTDPQQYRVYRMENEAIGGRLYHRLTRDQQRTLARSICRNYGIPQAKLVWRDLGRWAAEWHPENGDNKTIVLSTRKRIAQDMLTLTHELAHHLHHHLSGGIDETQENHGPEFMACHMSILDSCRVIPVQGMRAVCDAWKVRYADPGVNCSLARLRRIVRKRGRISPTA